VRQGVCDSGSYGVCSFGGASAVVRYARDTPLHVSIGIQMVVLLQWNLRSGSRIDDGDNILHDDEVYPPVAIENEERGGIKHTDTKKWQSA